MKSWTLSPTTCFLTAQQVNRALMINQSSAERPPILSTQYRHARAHLKLSTDSKNNTFIASQRMEHPFHITRPCVLEGDPDGMVTLYLQSSAGGLYRGDELSLNLQQSNNTQLHLTTQGGTIVHNTQNKQAKQSLSISLAEHSFCEYLPDPTVLFSGAAYCSNIQVNMAKTARLMLSDSFIWHDPYFKNNNKMDCKERPFNYYHSNIKIMDEKGKTIVIDRFQITGDMLLTDNPAINGDYRAQSSIFLIDSLVNLEQVLQALREALALVGDCYAGASILPNNSGVIVRFLASNGVILQQVLQTCWVILREQLFGNSPRIRRK